MKNNNSIGQSVLSHIQESLKDQAFNKHYHRAKIISEISQKVYELRIKSGLSQTEIAKKAETTQPVIARLESGKDKRIPSIELLDKIASATGSSLNISFN